jgi:predicted nucleic acid-binding protein
VDFVADTSLLVGLWRGQPWARAFAQINASRSLGIPWIVLGEFWHGATKAGHDPDVVQKFLTLGLPLMDPEPVVPVYARICARLQGQSSYWSISQNDLWIAAVAVALDRPLVTRNIRHFGQIDGLRVETAEV